MCYPCASIMSSSLCFRMLTYNQSIKQLFVTRAASCTELESEADLNLYTCTEPLNALLKSSSMIM